MECLAWSDAPLVDVTPTLAVDLYREFGVKYGK